MAALTPTAARTAAAPTEPSTICGLGAGAADSSEKRAQTQKNTCRVRFLNVLKEKSMFDSTV
jgi:hypothetical protein